MPAIASMEVEWPYLYWSYEEEDALPNSVVKSDVARSNRLSIPTSKPNFGADTSSNILPIIPIPVDTILPGDPIYKLNFSVDGVVERTIDGFVITAPIFDETGYGETYESAWDDLLSSIRDRYASLVKREQGLSPLDHKVLSELRKYLSEVTQ
jgi:hypothetical protein